MPHYSVSLDDFCEEVWDHLEKNQDGGAGHFARFTADTKEEAVNKAADCIKSLLESMMYESDDYGHNINEED